MAKRHPLQNALAPLFLPLSVLYGAAGSLKRRLTKRGILKSWRPPRPCVAVGNISWGGTGKTPVTDWLLSWADRKALSAAVLTRGYGAKPSHLPLKVEHGTPASECGDEPLMLARRHPRASVVVDPERTRAGKSLASLPDLFLLDDGFQHVRVQRDIDLVLLDQDDVRLPHNPGRHPSNWGRIIPAGSWREPASALHDASAFLIKAEPEDWPALVPALEQRLRDFPRPVFAFRLAPEGLRPLGADASAPALPAEALNGPYVFATGIGDPDQARHTASAFLGRAPEHVLAFPDHHDFQKEKPALEAAGLPIVCTGKDAVKLAPLGLSVPCFALDVQAVFFAALGAESFETWWDEQAARLCARHTADRG